MRVNETGCRPLAIQGDWDGKRLAGIVSSRSNDGKEQWRSTSREVSASRIVSSANQIFAIGSKGTDTFVPVVRAFSHTGEQLWTREFPELSEYNFFDVAPLGDGVAILAPNLWNKSAPRTRAKLLGISREGKLVKSVTVDLTDAPVGFVKPSRLANLDGRLVAALNVDAKIEMNFKLRNALGLPPVCFERPFAQVLEFDPNTFGLIAKTRLDLFQINSLSTVHDAWIVGGELFDNCQQRGGGAIFRIDKSRKVSMLWKDETVFPSEVRAVGVTDKIHVAVNTTRSLGIAAPSNRKTFKTWGKRDLESDTEALEAYIATLDLNGSLISKRYLSPGFSLFIQGIDARSESVIAYGSLGGVPALVFQRRSSIDDTAGFLGSR